MLCDKVVKWFLSGRVGQALLLDLKRIMKPVIAEAIVSDIRLWGDGKRLKIAPTAKVINTLFNTSSGFIEIGEYTFTGHNVSILTGTHHVGSLLEERMCDIPREGCDIKIGQGVWLGSNSVVLGPCKIGDHAVIAAGAVVVPGTEIPSLAVAAGIPAKIIKYIRLPDGCSVTAKTMGRL